MQMSPAECTRPFPKRISFHFTCVRRWQVTLCDPIWYVISRSSEVIYIKLLYPYTLTDLSTEVEVAEKDGRLRAGHNQDNKYEKQKSKHVVHLMK